MNSNNQQIPITRSDYKPTIYGKIKPIKKDILVKKMENDDKKTKGGVLIPNDNGKERGIRARWCEVYKVGPQQDQVKPGDWILVSHGRWTRPIPFVDENDEKMQLQKIDPKNNHEVILLVSNEEPKDLYVYHY